MVDFFNGKLVSKYTSPNHGNPMGEAHESLIHQTFQGNPNPKMAFFKVQYLHFRYLKLLVTNGSTCGRVLLAEAEKAFTEQSSDSFYASRGVRLQSLEMTRCFDRTGRCCRQMLPSYIYIYKESGWWFQILLF